MKRRPLLVSLLFASLAAPFAMVRDARAGSYLNRAQLLLLQGRAEADFLRSRFGDKELARVVLSMARARLEAAGTMLVPKEVVQAHPHLLLVFENYERSADAAVNNQVERYFTFWQRAQDEERTFRAVLKHLGWEIPTKEKTRS